MAQSAGPVAAGWLVAVVGSQSIVSTTLIAFTLPTLQRAKNRTGKVLDLSKARQISKYEEFMPAAYEYHGFARRLRGDGDSAPSA
jgi:hypothetical protein